MNVLQPNFSTRGKDIINFEKHFLNFIAKLISKFNVGFKMLLREGLLEPEF